MRRCSWSIDGAQLGAGEVRAEAAVDAGGERDVAVLHAIEIGLERVLERGRIEVGAGPTQVDHLALLDRHAVDLGVAQTRCVRPTTAPGSRSA